MNFNQLFVSVILALLSFVLYRFHLWWLDGRDENESFSKPGTRLGVVKNWTFIIATAIFAIVYVIKAIF